MPQIVVPLTSDSGFSSNTFSTWGIGKAPANRHVPDDPDRSAEISFLVAVAAIAQEDEHVQ
jgi:hypothetical protein